MKETTRKRAGSHRAPGESRLATVVGLSVLAFLGFGFGLLAGGLWEEPDLVLSHLAGRTEEVVLPDVASAPSDPQNGVAEVPPPAAQSASPRSPASAPDARPAPAPATRRVAEAQPATSGFAIQVGAFGSEGAAAKLVSKLRASGYPVYVATASGSSTWKVRVGPYTSREQADRKAATLKSAEKLPTWVLAEG